MLFDSVIFDRDCSFVISRYVCVTHTRKYMLLHVCMRRSGGLKYKEAGVPNFSLQFILAHLQWHEVKHKRRLYGEVRGGRAWKGGNRRSGFAPVVSEGSERWRTEGKRNGKRGC